MGYHAMGDCTTCNQYSEGLEDGRKEKAELVVKLMSEIKVLRDGSYKDINTLIKKVERWMNLFYEYSSENKEAEKHRDFKELKAILKEYKQKYLNK